MKLYYSLIMVACSMIVTASLKAEMFCATDAVSFSNALMIAQGNGQDDEIRLTPGTYIGTFQYQANSNENFDLSISGGWTPFFENPCFFEGVSAFDTVLDGNDAGMVLNINNSLGSDITIKSITVINGRNNNSSGPAGMSIGETITFGDVLIERVAFVNNNAVSIGALRVLNGDKVTVRNSLFVLNNNTSGSANVLISNVDSAQIKGVYFNNNTVINNTSDGAGLVNGGVKLTTLGLDSGLFIANNILWGNTGRDLEIPFNNANTHLAFNNNIEDQFGTYSDSGGNYNQPPIFASGGFLDFVPALNSAEVDNGRNPPPFIPVPTPFGLDWTVGEYDINGQLRTQANGVDIGAFEAAPEIPIFKDGFDG